MVLFDLVSSIKILLFFLKNQLRCCLFSLHYVMKKKYRQMLLMWVIRWFFSLFPGPCVLLLVFVILVLPKNSFFNRKKYLIISFLTIGELI